MEFNSDSHWSLVFTLHSETENIDFFLLDPLQTQIRSMQFAQITVESVTSKEDSMHHHYKYYSVINIFLMLLIKKDITL